jgi:cardiolipin synthase
VTYQKIRNIPFLQVSYLGKAATFNLLYAFPFLLLEEVKYIGGWCFVIGWAFAIWGIALYFYTGLQYLVKGLQRK